jgi:aspartokinase
VIATDNIGKLSIVGVGMKSHTGVAGRCSKHWPAKRSTST